MVATAGNVVCGLRTSLQLTARYPGETETATEVHETAAATDVEEKPTELDDKEDE